VNYFSTLDIMYTLFGFTTLCTGIGGYIFIVFNLIVQPGVSQYKFCQLLILIGL